MGWNAKQFGTCSVEMFLHSWEPQISFTIQNVTCSVELFITPDIPDIIYGSNTPYDSLNADSLPGDVEECDKQHN